MEDVVEEAIVSHSGETGGNSNLTLAVESEATTTEETTAHSSPEMLQQCLHPQISPLTELRAIDLEEGRKVERFCTNTCGCKMVEKGPCSTLSKSPLHNHAGECSSLNLGGNEYAPFGSGHGSDRLWATGLQS